MASQQVTLQALGLNYSPNTISLPQGSLIQADDVIIRRDNVVESRRGYREYSEGIGASDDRAKQLIEYKEKVLVHYSNKLAFDTSELDSNGKAIFDEFSGTYSETQTGLRIKSIEANKNLYFTTDAGIKKIAARTAADFTTASGYIKNAGAIKALDISGRLDSTQGELSGFLPNDSTVAYRAVWGYKDINENLILGTPSNRIEIYNYLTDTMVMDINALTVNLDILDQSTSLITDGDYATSFYTPINSEAITLLTNVQQLAIKLDQDILLANDTGTGAPLNISTAERNAGGTVRITFSSGDPTQYMTIGDSIEITGAVAPFDVLNTNSVLTDVQTTYIEFILGTGVIASASPGGATQIFSYNYRNITATGDLTYTTPLDSLTLSIPATAEQIATIQNTLSRIVERLKVELPGVIPSTLMTDYITPFVLTNNANVEITVTIPTTIDSDYFVQIYRSRIFTASGGQTLGGAAGVPVIPDDEMRLVYEAFPTSSEISAGYLVFLDTSPEELVQFNTNLYTNPETGEGLIAANEPPPFAKDINRFKNVVFYANTRTKQRLSTFQLLGVSNINSGDKITIASADGSDTYTFISGKKEITDVTCASAASITSGMYFNLYSQSGVHYAPYYIKDNTGSAPVVSGATLIRIDILTGDTANQVATKTLNTLNELIYDFSVIENTLPTIRITSIDEGKCTAASDGDTGFTITQVQAGDGEDAASKQVLLSSLTSAAQAIDQTAQSLIRVINKQSTSVVNGYYISSNSSSPGQINLEEKSLTVNPFYVMGSAAGIGSSFNPDIGPIHTDISAISIDTAAVITTSNPHGLLNGDQIVISNTDSTPIVDGLYTVTVLSTTTFSVPVTTTVVGTQGSWSTVADTIVSNNEVKPNRVYYSKLGQPEAVPLLNYFDISAEDKQILRIFPLRDTLFAFKEDGTYRISGEIAPWSVSLLDSSCIVIAPDSVAAANNIVHAWTSKGITPISETGASTEISRPIDTEILRLSSSTFTNFSTITWGVGYDSDSSYTVYTNSDTSDTAATIAFRYCTLTNTWTNFIRSQTCGINLISQDVLYMGSADFNLIHKERKDFTRTDYADKDFEVNLADGNLNSASKTLTFTSVSGINVGDSITQEQTLTTYQFNSLLRQLDNDPSVGVSAIATSSGAGTSITITTVSAHQLSNGDYVDLSMTDSYPSLDGLYQINTVTSNTFKITITSPLLVQASTGIVKRNYESTLEAVSGDNMRDKIVDLAVYLDTDPGTSFSDYSSRIGIKTGSISSNSVANPTVITTSSAHGLVDGRIVTISGTQSPLSIPIITGNFAVDNTGTFGSSTTFTIDKDVTTAGGSGLSFSTAPNLNTFEDIQACYNEIVSRLNSDSGVTYSSYQPITNVTLYEAVVLSVNAGLNRITVNLPLEWVVGPMTVYNAINCEFTYSPITFGDPLMNKQVSESTVMFNNRAITKFTVAFSSDLKPEYSEIDMYGQGNGIFGHYSDPGFGYGFFGGESNSAPFRTIIPAQNQRCRFINMKITHKVARENWAILGTTLTANLGISQRAYR
jgi:hypothetical protein